MKTIRVAKFRKGQIVKLVPPHRKAGWSVEVKGVCISATPPGRIPAYNVENLLGEPDISGESRMELEK